MLQSAHAPVRGREGAKRRPVYAGLNVDRLEAAGGSISTVSKTYLCMPTAMKATTNS